MDFVGAASITRALNQPTGSPTLSEIIHAKDKAVDDLTVCITVSDITRPAPYKGAKGLLLPLLGLIEAAGVKRENIVFVIGNGMHRHSTRQERLYMYGPEVVDNYRIVDHDCEDDASMVPAARTRRGTEVHLNKIFFESDFDIIPGPNGYDFIESEAHFATDGEKATAMLQNSIICAVNHPRFEGRKPTMAYIEEGPYAVPMAVE